MGGHENDNPRSFRAHILTCPQGEVGPTLQTSRPRGAWQGGGREGGILCVLCICVLQHPDPLYNFAPGVQGQGCRNATNAEFPRGVLFLTPAAAPQRIP